MDVAFGYVNFVERVGEGGIETIERPGLEIREEQNSTKWSSFLAKLLNARNKPLFPNVAFGWINLHKSNRTENKVQSDRFRLCAGG